MEKNIVWHEGKVKREERIRLLGQSGLVVWLTGLSGAGKSTIGNELEKFLIHKGRAAYLLDGDNLRCGINSDLGFSDEDRNENVRRLGEIAALFCDAGMIVLVAAISPFRAMREFARSLIGEENFIEVFVKTDLAVCEERDPKGLYKKKIENFTGIDSIYEEPLTPDIVLETVEYPPRECAEVVWREIENRLQNTRRPEDEKDVRYCGAGKELFEKSGRPLCSEQG